MRIIRGERMEQVLKISRTLAVDAAIAAGKIAKEKFNSGIAITEKDVYGDVVTEADISAEKEILARIRAQFPEHQIRSEETGWSGVAGDWLWLVDPLDGTNNYAVGLPVFGVAITLIYRREPVLGVIYDSVLEQVYIAEKGKGATCEGRALHVGSRNEVGKMTLGWIQGHQVQKADPAMKLKHHLDYVCKRVLRLWAPSLLWCMLARGDLDGIVLYDSEGDDLYAGILMAKEAGAVLMDFDGNPFVGMNPEPYIIACHPDHRKTFLAMVKEGYSDTHS